MGFQDAVRSGFRNWLDFEGRATRSEYWWWVVFQIAVSFGLNVISFHFLAGLFVIICLVPSLSLAVRRLHDIDKSGFWLLLTFVPFGGLALLVMFCLEGTQGANQYGPDPLGHDDDTPTSRRGRRSEFDDVMDDSYRRSRIPRSGHDD